MNLISFVLDETPTDLHHFRATARCLIHTILFQRMVEPTRPKEMNPPEFDTIDYVMNPRLEENVEEHIDKLRGLLRKKKFIQLTLSLRRVTKESGWFSSEETVEWERWTLPIRLTFAMKESDVKDQIQNILKRCDARVEHFPAGKLAYAIYDASEEKGWTFADLAQLIKARPPSLVT
jgi:hypothetical protein